MDKVSKYDGVFEESEVLKSNVNQNDEKFKVSIMHKNIMISIKMLFIKTFDLTKLHNMIIYQCACLSSTLTMSIDAPKHYDKYSWLLYVNLFLNLFSVIVFFLHTMSIFIGNKFRSNLNTSVNINGNLNVNANINVSSMSTIVDNYYSFNWNIFDLFIFIISLVATILNINDLIGGMNDQSVIIGPFNVLKFITIIRFFSFHVSLNISALTSKKMLMALGLAIFVSVYFAIIAAIFGLQIFGQEQTTCIIKKNLPRYTNSTTILDIVNPFHFCGIDLGYKCPNNFYCCSRNECNIYSNILTMNNILSATVNVYMISTQDGWVDLFINGVNSGSIYLTLIYFLLVIYFVAWLAKNVFIAFTNQAFDDIKIDSAVKNFQANKKQLHDKNADGTSTTMDYVLKYLGNSNGFKLFRIDTNNWFLIRLRNSRIKKIFDSVIYKCIFMAMYLFEIAILVNRSFLYYYAVLYVNIVFWLDSILKLLYFGPKVFVKNIHLVLDVILEICTVPTLFNFNNHLFDFFFFFRYLRAVKILFMFDSFRNFFASILVTPFIVFRVFFFSAVLLYGFSSVTLQLFCRIESGSNHFEINNFGDAIKIISVLCLQDNWMNYILDATSNTVSPYYYIKFAYFLFCHLIVAVIMYSILVASLLSNANSEVQTKLIQQQIFNIKSFNYKQEGNPTATSLLPLHLRLYKLWPNNPKLIEIPGDPFGHKFRKIRLNYIENFSNDYRYLSFYNKFISQLQMDYFDEYFNDENHLNQQYENMEILSSKFYNNQLVNNSLSTEHSTKVVHSNYYNANIYQRHYLKIFEQIRLKTNPKIFLRKRNSSNAFKLDLNYSNDLNHQVLISQINKQKEFKKMELEQLQENHQHFDNSLFFLSPENRFRRFIHKIVHARYEPFKEKATIFGKTYGSISFKALQNYLNTQTYLEFLLIFATHCSCIAMFLEKPLAGPFFVTWMSVIEYIFLIVSTVEILFRIISDGFLFTTNSLLSRGAGCLHFFIYLSSLSYLFGYYIYGVEVRQVIKNQIIEDVYVVNRVMKVLMVLRCLRPLKIITLSPPLVRVSKMIIGAYKELFYVLIFTSSFICTFAIFGCFYFSTTMDHCNDSTISIKSQCVGLFESKIATSYMVEEFEPAISILIPRVWTKPDRNFDTLAESFLTVLDLFAIEGWSDVLEDMDDANGFFGFIYVLIIVFTSNLLCVSLFIIVAVKKFNDNRGITILTNEQKYWELLKSRLRVIVPLKKAVRPENAFRGWIFDFINRYPYRIFNSILLILPAFILCISKLDNNKNGTFGNNMFKALIGSFGISTLMDILLMLLAYGPKYTIFKSSNIISIITSIVGITLSILIMYIPDNNYLAIYGITFICFLTMVRVFMVSLQWSIIRDVMLSFFVSVVRSFYAISIIFLITYSYSLFGVVLFGHAKIGNVTNEIYNFKSAFNAFIILFQVTTSEAWNGFRDDLVNNSPLCIEATQNNPITDCGNYHIALLYFITYLVINNYILLNILIAAVVESFSLIGFVEVIMNPNRPVNLDLFQSLWSRFDKNHSGIITLSQSKIFVRIYNHFMISKSINSTFSKDIHSSSSLYYEELLCTELDQIANNSSRTEAHLNQKTISFHQLIFLIAYRSIEIEKSLDFHAYVKRKEFEEAISEKLAMEVIYRFISLINLKKIPEQLHINISETTTDMIDNEISQSNKSTLFPNETSIKRYSVNYPDFSTNFQPLNYRSESSSHESYVPTLSEMTSSSKTSSSIESIQINENFNSWLLSQFKVD